MLNIFAKFLLMATSLSPVLGAVAVNQFARHEPWTRWAGWLVAAVFLVFVCWAVLRYAARNAQQHLFHIKEFERNDTEVLAFLLAYLLPFVSSKDDTHPDVIRPARKRGQSMSTLSADDQRALDALRSAVAEALERKRRLGQYAVIWRNGQVVRIEPEKDASSEHPEQPDNRG
jgi:hypothetical protein